MIDTSIKRPILTVDAFCLNGSNKVLLIRRKNPPYGWALPGGLVDYGETVEEAVVRELREETGLIADIKDLLYPTVFSAKNRDPRFHAVSVTFGILAFTGVAKAADDAKEVGWFSKEEMGDLTIAFDHRSIINTFLPFMRGAYELLGY